MKNSDLQPIHTRRRDAARWACALLVASACGIASGQARQAGEAPKEAPNDEPASE